MNDQAFHLRMGEGRRIVLPPEVCDQLHLGVGDTVIVAVENDQVCLRSIERSVARFQALVAERVPVEISLVDELIQEREANAEHE